MGVNVQQLAATVCIVAHLGCRGPTWPGGIQAHLAWSSQRTRVIATEADGGAARAGVLPGDELVSIDGKPVQGLDADTLHDLLEGEVGSMATLEVLREGQSLTFEVERTPYRRAH